MPSRISGSKLPLVYHCRGAFAPTVVWPPSPPGRPAIYGTAFHAAVELWYASGEVDLEGIAAKHGLDVEEAARLAPNDNDDILFDCEVGITDVDCAIAESGSLVVSTNGRIRNAWVTPPIHIAIVRASQVLADLVDLFEQRPDALEAASTTIITGPSKTADIEGVLVTGVHGPAAVEIVLVG